VSKPQPLQALQPHALSEQRAEVALTAAAAPLDLRKLRVGRVDMRQLGSVWEVSGKCLGRIPK